MNRAALSTLLLAVVASAVLALARSQESPERGAADIAAAEAIVPAGTTEASLPAAGGSSTLMKSPRRRLRAAASSETPGTRECVLVVELRAEASDPELPFRGPVSLRGPDGIQAQSSVGPEGTARFPSLPAGEYHLDYAGPDFRVFRGRRLTLGGEAAEVHHLLEGRRRTLIPIRVSTRSGAPLLASLGAAQSMEGHRLKVLATDVAPPLGRPFYPNRVLHPRDVGAGVPRDGPAPSLAEDHAFDLAVENPPASFEVSLLFDHVVLATEPCTPQTPFVRFIVDPEDLTALLGSVQGIVLDQAAGPAAGLEVRLVRGFGGGTVTHTASDGRFHVPGLRPGRFDLRISQPGAAEIRRSFFVESGRVVDLGRLQLQRPVRIHGSLIGEERASRTVQIERLRPADAEQRQGCRTTVRSEEDGSFAVTDLEPGRYALRVVQTGGVQAEEMASRSAHIVVDVREGSARDVRIPLRRLCRVRVHLRYELGADVRITVRDDLGLRVHRSFVCAADCQRVLHLVEGAYTLEVSRNGQRLETRELRAAGRSMEVTLGG